MRQRLQSHRELTVYQRAFQLAEEVFTISGPFPRDERYALTDQLRRAARSVCANLAEAWRKRRYKAAFIGKLSDVEAEAAETQCWLEFARSHGYVSPELAEQLIAAYDELLGSIVGMIDHADKWLLPGSH